MSLTHEVCLLLGMIPALLDAAIKLASPLERLTLPEGRIVVTVAGRPQAFRSPADALAVAERRADDLRMICEQAARVLPPNRPPQVRIRPFGSRFARSATGC